MKGLAPVLFHFLIDSLLFTFSEVTIVSNDCSLVCVLNRYRVAVNLELFFLSLISLNSRVSFTSNYKDFEVMIE